MSQIDPRLLTRLDSAAEGNHEIGAVITVQDLSPEATPLTPEATSSLVEKLVGDVQTATGIAPGDVRVQRNLGTFMVRAKPNFIKALIGHADVHYAASTEIENGESMLIPPVNRRVLPNLD